MSRPFTNICISLMAGIFLFSMLYNRNSRIPIEANGLFLLFGILLIVSLLFPEKNTIYLYLAFLLLGGFLYHQALTYPTVLRNYTSEEIGVQGKITAITYTDQNYREYDMKISRFLTNNGDVSVKEKGRLKHLHAEANLQPGDTIKVKNAIITDGFTEDLQGYRRYLRSRGYNLLLEAGNQEIEKLDVSHGLGIMNTSYHVRSYIEDYFDTSLDGESSHLLKSIMFGNQGYMSREMRSVFSKSGTAHMVAVSGLHVGLMVFFIHGVLGFFELSKGKILIVTMVFLWLYAYMVGFPVSIIRANSMYCFYVFSFFLHRRYDGINILMMVAFFLLLANPFHLFSVSFQLSFAATLSIFLFYPIIKEGLTILPNFLKGLLAITIAAQIGTTPIIAYHFQEISLISFVANPLIIPMLTPLMAIAFLSVFFSLIPLGVEIVLNNLLEGMLTYIYWMATRLSQLPFASIKIENRRILPIAMYYGIVTIVYFIVWKNKQQKRKGRNTYELQGSNEEAKS